MLLSILKPFLKSKRFQKWGLTIGVIVLAIILAQQFLMIKSSKEQVKDLKIAETKDPRLDNQYIIFLNGLGCKYNGDLPAELGFPKIRRSLAKAGYANLDERFLLYSYTGGKVIKGKWHPNKYSALDTGQPIPLSVNQLDFLIHEFSKSHPEARYILVGHSLGGRVALDFACSADASIRKKIKGVISLNSPLLGAGVKLPEALLGLLNNPNFLYTSPAIKQLLWEVDHQKEMVDLRRQAIRELQRDGIKVATFSTRQDLVVRPLTGNIVDEKGNPITEGSIINVKAANLSVREIFGHMKILEREEVLKYITGLCLN